MSQSNPVVKELDKLTEQWQQFVDSDLPVLHWKIPPDGSQLVNAFIKVKEQFDEKNPDLFIHLTTPFKGAQQFGWSLNEEFNVLVEEGLADSLEGEEDLTWRKADVTAVKSGFQALFISCRSLLELFGDYLDSLVLVIAPTAIESPEEYRQWWDWSCKIHRDYDEWHSQLRLVTFDQVNSPFLQTVADQYPEQVMSCVAPIDYTGALNKVLAEADDGSPGAKLRQCLFDMNNAITAKDAETLRRASATALPLAEQNGWLDLAATVVMTRAAGYLNWQSYDPAIADYRQAQALAEQGRQQAIPGCDKLLLQSMLNEATALYLSKQLALAANLYEQTAVKANELNDPWMALESWRMGSFCYEQNQNRQQAWSLAKQALKVGEAMSKEERPHSTLPFVGQALLRMSPNSQVAGEVNDVMMTLLDDDWQTTVRQASA